MDTQSNEPKYKMTIDLSVLDHLGVGLYGNVPAVLSEAVANAWDADAENVCISINPKQDMIEIYDDGHGMTVDDINNKYLKVGYKKREREPDFGRTPKFNRHPMGRKGIGKLSLFSIADIIEIHTVKDDEKNALRMNSDDIRSKIASRASDEYNPEPLASDIVTISQGTRIKLSGLKKRIDRADAHLRKRLARRFSIIGNDKFNISIDDYTIDAKDRDYFTSIEYLWYFGKESERFVHLCRNIKGEAVCTSPELSVDDGYRVSGWIGTVRETKQVNEETNTIVVFAKGKLAHLDILGSMQEGGIWTKYVIGEIDADFVDDNDKEDMITSSRQSVNEDDSRYTALRDFLKKGVIREIASNWQTLRQISNAAKLRKRTRVMKWLDRFEGDQQDQAFKLLAKIEGLDVDQEVEKLPFFRAIMYAFERLSVTQQLSILNQLQTKEDFELISKIFGNLTELTSVHYYDIAKVRLALIKKFQEIIDDDKKEKVIQEHIFKALWLLDPSWERAASNVRMEETVMKEFDRETERLSDEEKRARIDIRYQSVSGSHVIVELKRYSRHVEFYSLLRQLRKYKDALQKCLSSKFKNYANLPIAIVCITGSRDLSEEEERHLITANVRWLTYDELIQNALLSYNDYLNKEKHINALVEIIESIEKDFEM